MLWHPILSAKPFRSRVVDTDEASTGKWLVPISVPDIGLIWEDIEDAAIEGTLLAIKKSTGLLLNKLGHDLVCVYCGSSDRETVSETLQVLREIGVSGEIEYKSDLATFEGRDENLWSSNDLEPGMTPKEFCN